MRAFVLTAASLLTCLQARAQVGEGQTADGQAQHQVLSPAPPAAAPILEIYNFALAGGAESSEQARVLQQAVPDALYLRFLGDARIDVRRVREPYTSTASHSVESRLDETTRHYVLDGKIAFMQGGAALSAPAARQAVSNFVLITYSLRDVGSAGNSKAPVDKDETSGFAQLSGTLRRISGQVITTILPPSKITVQVNAPQFKDFPASRQPFYSQNLPDLLKTAASRQSWIEIVEGNATPNYEINETLRTGKDKGYELQAVISHAGVSIGNVLTEPAGETGVLAAQIRLADEIVDALKVDAALAPALQTAAAQPSSDDYYKSGLAYQRTDPDLAIALYKKAIARDASNTDAKLSLAFSYVNKNQTDEALKILSDAELDTSAYGQYLRSVAYTYADNQDDALKAINRAVELAPSEDASYYWRGYIFDRAKDYGKAVQDYEAASRLNPTDADYYESSARALEKLGKYDDAVAILEKGRTQTSEGPRLTTLLNDTRRRTAAHYLDAGKPAEGMRYAQASVKDDETSEWGQRLVGIAYHGLGNLPEAAKSLNRALEIEKTVQAYTELAQVRLEQGNKTEAFALAEKGIELDSSATTPYGVLEKGIQGPEEAKEVIDWLKVYAAANPPARNALVDWDYFQLIYRPNDSGEIAALYSAYESATKSVPYSDWLDGWTNFVELGLIQGKYRQASTAAGEILKVTPKFEYQMPMLFYQWIAQVLDGDCVASQNSLRALTEFLARPAVDNFQNSWNYQCTRAYLQVQVSRGALDADSYAIMENAMSLLESRPMKRAKTDAFLAKIRSLKNLPCPSRASRVP